jgi:hypothetical protein
MMRQAAGVQNKHSFFFDPDGRQGYFAKARKVSRYSSMISSPSATCLATSAL